MEDNEKKILINVEDDETRIAVVDNATLDNLYIEQTHRTQILGNIYFGKVVKIQPSFQAAFVDYGADRHGFLAISDINSQLFKPNRATRGRPSINQLLKTGQQIMVQVIKDEVGHKGATLSTNISLPGRFLVFMPDSERGGVSRKIEDEEQRARLKHLLKGLGSEDASAIIRTAGVDRSLSELKRDFMNLRRIWNQIKQKFEEFEKPGLIYQEEEATTRMIRDYFTEDVGQVIIDDANAFQRTLEFFQANMPSQQNRLQLYLGEKTLFASYGIEAQVECLYRNQVPLPSGGSLVVVPTEALVAIDVNSGRSTKGKNIEETALGTNLEAAEEAARQLRLRNLGGLIVIDFIDMDLVKNRRAVEEKLADALKTDKARCTLGEISQFGLLELSRQRIAGSISRNSPELTMANLILRKIQDLAFEQKVSEIFMKLPIKLATHLLNVKRRQLSQLEMDYELRVEIKPDPTLELEELPEMEVVHKTTHGEMRSSIPIHAAELYEEGKNKSSRKRGRKKKQTEEESVTENKDSEVSAIKQDTGEIPTEDSKEITHEKEKLTLTDEPPQSDLNQVEEIESNSEVSSDAASPESKPQEKEEISAGLLFSSVHENNEKLEDQEWSPPTVSEWRLKLQQAPDHSTIYSSSHESLNPEGLAENQSETNEDSNKTSEIQKPSLIQESSETSESSEGSQTDALVSSKPKKKPASQGRSRNKSNQTGKSDQNDETIEGKQDSSSKTPAKKTASRSRSQTLKSKKAIDTSELNEKAEKASTKKSDADSTSESEKDSKKEEVSSATPKAPEKKRTRKKPSSKTPEKAAEQSGGDDVSSATTKKPPRSRSRKKKSSSAEGADET
ncbi:MAG: Rne/Rng family ribonuclease [bacterium]